MALLPRTEAPSTVVPDFVAGLHQFGDAVALIGPAGTLTYRDLDARVNQFAAALAGSRRLVLIAGANDPQTIVAYLGALRAGHVVLLVPANAAAALDRRYDPDVAIGALDGSWRVRVRREVTVHELHPDLALLLTTSGSTGSAKLVRLSSQNLQTNAHAIAEYLGLTATDRAATTLPMHYSYGLSVIHSHLVRGASLILTERSVTDEALWTLLREREATSFAGVPYTFELLDRIGFENIRLPTLRCVTQAGGRLSPARVRHFAELGRNNGWQFFVMYGQTEATARIAYLPADLAPSHPECVGIAIPGGSIRLDPLPDWPDPDTGELVYSGPNVMLGYADGPDDLRLGRTVDELRTGDVARLTPAGLYEIVGRRSRFLKIYGLRIDLRQVEELMARQGLTAHCVGDDRRLMVAVVSDRLTVADAKRIGGSIADQCGLPSQVVRVVIISEVPRLESGKVDYQALWTVATPDPLTAVTRQRMRMPQPRRASASPPPDVAAIFASVLDRRDVTGQSTFVGLGGDSLSYVEASVQLERALGRLPTNWHTMTVRELNDIATPRRWRTLETSVALRAVLILLIAANHRLIVDFPGGAHILVAVVGYNFGRFQAAILDRGDRSRRLGATIARIAIPTMIFSALSWAAGIRFSWTNVLFLELILHRGPEHAWFLWFVDMLVYTLTVMLLLLSTGVGHYLLRRFPFGLPLGLVGVGLLLRYDLVPFVDLSNRNLDSWSGALVRPFFLFALGWAAARATTPWQRMVVTLVAALAIQNYFGNPTMDAFVTIGIAVLIWLPSVPSTAMVNRVAGIIASASLYIYITHFTLMDVATIGLRWIPLPLDLGIPALSVAVAVVGGIGVMRLAEWAETRMALWWPSLAKRRGVTPSS